MTAALVGIAVAVGVAAAFGLLVSHIRGDQFLLGTLALGMVAWGAAYRWVSMTGGDNGLPGIPRPSLGPVSLADQHAMYWATLAVFVVVLACISVLRRSPFGYALVGIRENEVRLRSLGYNVWLHKYLAFVMSGAVAGVGGVL
ncbi:MAG: branched-chain amino acid ABC transporter permease [Firmicutes bacterium]|nr:branched-chain amino acid ABC transporter permease [Bacillota bacterium]